MDFKILILQIFNDSTFLKTSNEPMTVSVFDLLLKGGFMMIPIFILFIISIYILFEKILVLKKESRNTKGFNKEIKERVSQGDINGAKLICQDTNTPSSRMILKGLTRIDRNLKH